MFAELHIDPTHWTCLVLSSFAYPGQTRLPSPLLLPAALPRESRGVPRSAVRNNPSSVSCVGPGVSSWLNMPGIPPLPDARTVSTVSSMWGSRSSNFSPFQMSELLTLSLRQSTLRRKHISATTTQSCSRGHDPKLMTIDEGGRVGW